MFIVSHIQKKLSIIFSQAQGGSGDYSMFVENLVTETIYEYQMCEGGEVKSFTMLYSIVSDGDGISDITTPTGTPQESDFLDLYMNFIAWMLCA